MRLEWFGRPDREDEDDVSKTVKVRAHKRRRKGNPTRTGNLLLHPNYEVLVRVRVPNLYPNCKASAFQYRSQFQNCRYRADK